MSEIIEFEIPFIPEPFNVIQRKYKNPYKRNSYNKSWYQAVYVQVIRKKPPEPWSKVLLNIIVHKKNGRFYDYDGCVAGLKPVVDGLVHAKIISDDNYFVTGPWTVTQEKSDRDFVSVKITRRE